MGKKVKISDERFMEIMRQARADRDLRISEEWKDKVPEHADEAADRAFKQMEAWIAMGAIPALTSEASAGRRGRSGKTAKAMGAGAHVKITAAAVAAAVVIGAGSYAASPGVRRAVSGLCAVGEKTESPRAPAAYEIPSPGEGYSLREDVSTDTMTARWYTAERRLLMVQIAYELPEEPSGEGDAVIVGRMPGMAYDVKGDQQLVIRDGDVSILIKMFNADRQELLDYAAALAEANDLAP